MSGHVAAEAADAKGACLALDAEIIETLPVAKTDERGPSLSPHDVSRAKSIGLSGLHQEFLTRYVNWLLATRN